MKKKRKIKELTVKRWAEFCFIRKRKDVLTFDKVRRAVDHGSEIYIHKVNLENMFDETDSKQQKMEILKILIELEFLVLEGRSEDLGRYTKMGLRLKSNAALFNFRNGLSVHFI